MEGLVVAVGLGAILALLILIGNRKRGELEEARVAYQGSLGRLKQDPTMPI